MVIYKVIFCTLDEINIPSVPLINMSNFTDIDVLELEAETDVNSQPINIPNGLVFGDDFVTSAYVSHIY